MSFACPLCDTQMVLHKTVRRLLECPHCSAMCTSNVAQSHWANRLAVQRIEQMAEEAEKRAEMISWPALAVLLRDRLFRGGVR